MPASERIVTPERRPKHGGSLRPFVLFALSAALLGGSLGLVYLLELHLALGPVNPASLRTHGQIQVFGFLVPFVVGFGTFVIPRIAGGRPLRRPKLLAFALIASATALAMTLAALVTGGRTAPSLNAIAGVATAAASLAAALALAGPILDSQVAAGSTRGYLLLAGLALAFLALAGCLDGAGWVEAAWEGIPTMPEGVAFAIWRLAIEGFATGMALAVASRMFPGFLGIDPRSVYPSAGSARVRSAGINLVFWLSAAAWALATGVGALGFIFGRVRVENVADIVFAAGVIPFCARLGFGRSELLVDRTRDRWFPWGARMSFALLLLAALVGAMASGASLAGSAVHGWWWDARRHLITLGFLMTLIATMAGRLAPGYAGRDLALPALRVVSLFGFPLAALLRATEAVSGQWGPASLLNVSAASGPVALGAFLSLSISIGVTLCWRNPVQKKTGTFPT
jgi:hypothetical protein